MFFDLKPDLTLDYIIYKELERFKNEVKTGDNARVRGYKIQMSNFTDSKSLNVSDIDLKWYKDLSTYLSKLGNNGSTVQKKIKTAKIEGLVLNEDLQISVVRDIVLLPRSCLFTGDLFNVFRK